LRENETKFVAAQNLERKGHNPQAVLLVGMHHGNVKESRVFHWCYDPTIRKQMAFGMSQTRLVSETVESDDMHLFDLQSITGFTTFPSVTGEVDKQSQAILGPRGLSKGMYFAISLHLFC
jgi:hypothetical protein